MVTQVRRDNETQTEATRLNVFPPYGARDPRRPPTPPPLATSPLEYCTDEDRFHDYLLEGYKPKGSVAGKLRGVNLLTESFALAGVETEGRALIDDLREHFGPFRTVWGIKLDPSATDATEDERLRWELYFSDRDRQYADVSIPRIAELLAPHMNVTAREPRPLAWHRFSVEFGAKHLRAGGEAPLDVYLGMRSYKLDGASMCFENLYSFHDAKREIRDVLERLRTAFHFDSVNERLADVLPPHLFDCHRICVANKRRSDALYFSRIKTPALLRFLAEHQWPSELSTFANARADAFDPLRWDVGIDFVARNGRATPVKTGVYGSF